MHSTRKWTKDELSLIDGAVMAIRDGKSIYSQCTRLVERLPTRSWEAIRQQINKKRGIR